MRSPARIPPSLLIILLASLATGAIARAQDSDGGRRVRTRGLDSMPRALDHGTLEALREPISRAVFAARSEEHLPRGFRPDVLTGDGAAVWVVLDDGQPHMVTAFAWLANADQIEIEVGGAWHEVTLAHATPMFDLAELVLSEEAAAALRAEDAAPLAADWGAGAELLAWAPAGSDEDGDLVIGALGAPPRGESAYYARSLLEMRNGYGLFDRTGALVAICSLAATDRHGGSLAIPFGHVAEWVAEWPRISGDSLVGWQPRVIVEHEQLTGGRDALRPRAE